jgi:hypothetical protein
VNDEPQASVPEMIRALLDEDTPVMVTTWALVAEYIDETGAAGVAAWASDDPPWRVNGLMHAGIDMLDVDEYEDEEDEID